VHQNGAAADVIGDEGGERNHDSHTQRGRERERHEIRLVSRVGERRQQMVNDIEEVWDRGKRTKKGERDHEIWREKREIGTCLSVIKRSGKGFGIGCGWVFVALGATIGVSPSFDPLVPWLPHERLHIIYEFLIKFWIFKLFGLMV
jgi:hypothetical protein